MKSTYLFVYNAGMLLGWFALGVQVLWHVHQTGTFVGAYEAGSILAQILQAISILETVHAAAGLVKSNVVMNFMQWAGRAHALFVIVQPYPEIHQSIYATAMLLAWSIGECTRYPWYAYAQLGECPYALTWLRYTAFLFVYPVGMFAELKCMWDSMPLLKATRPWSWSHDLGPFYLTLDYPTLMQVFIYLYPFLWLQIYGSLLSKRGSALGKKDKAHTD